MGWVVYDHRENLTMSPTTYLKLNEGDLEWINGQLNAATQFVARYSSPDAGDPLNISNLDRAFTAWARMGVTDRQVITDVCSIVGIAFASFLVRDAGFTWVVSSDVYTHEIAISSANAIINPADFVEKQYARHQTHFLEDHFRNLVAQNKAVKSKIDRDSQSIKSLWKRVTNK